MNNSPSYVSRLQVNDLMILNTYINLSYITSVLSQFFVKKKSKKMNVLKKMVKAVYFLFRFINKEYLMFL